MLYVTTREKNDAFTAHRTLLSDCGPDGGRYLPFRMPQLDEKALANLESQSFAQTVAQILNSFFSCRLSPWDIELCTGRYPIRGISLNRTTLVGQMWHNVDWDYLRIQQTLGLKICDGAQQKEVTSWVRIAIRISVLFALYGEFLKNGLLDKGQVFDIAVATGDFSAPIAAYYARQIGLPVGNIVSGCNENSGLWELMHLGQLRTDNQMIQTVTPLNDYTVPPELERYIFGILGREEVTRFAACCENQGIYTLRPDQQALLRAGFATAVVSGSRVKDLIYNEYKTSGNILGLYSALAYGALIDVRSRTGESRTAVILSDRSPVCDGFAVANALDMTQDALAQLLQKG